LVPAPTAATSPPHPFAAIFWGGLLAGIFDITQAFVAFGLLGAKPFRILQHIAGGVLGARSMQMGWTSASLGLVFHFTIAFTAAAVYYLASRVLRVLVERTILCGLIYANSYSSSCTSLCCHSLHWGPPTLPSLPTSPAYWPHVSGGVAHRAFRSAFCKVNARAIHPLRPSLRVGLLSLRGGHDVSCPYEERLR
jgi:hypothetical protein